MENSKNLNGIKNQLHVISTGQQSIQKLVDIAGSIHSYIDVLHIREKSWTAKEIVMTIEALGSAGFPLEKIMVNDRVDIAYLMKTGGVQLTHHSIEGSLVKQVFPTLKMGSSIHSMEEAKHAFQQGADFLLYGNIFPTLSKEGKPGVGIQKLKDIVQTVPIPIVAIGGITQQNTIEVLSSGCNGIAVLSGILQSDNPLDSAKLYREKLDQVVSRVETIL
ncbi:thiazole tautomerase TenI [Peribacillus alkalitolerans]|uniref:thiazole tautomerase TenI n=1 Tax=Peribacillus alkalitolerans TaxID=1550385 RepID=UPI0013D7BE5A|nr:thiazole tautomerase TenI [Peribacillus alkalitolerans]